MMYSRLKLRERTKFCVPEGPSFSKAKRIAFSLDGTQIEFSAPKHSPSDKVVKAFHPERCYTSDNMFYRSSFHKDFNLTDSWEFYKLFYSEWVYSGPWFTGPMTELSLSVNVIKLKEPNSQVSFFHPRVFEQNVGDDLSNRYAKKNRHGRSAWIAPQNWHPITNLPVNAVRLQVAPDEYLFNNSTYEYVYFPINHQCLAVMSFNPAHIECDGTQAERNKSVDPSPMLNLMNSIIGSLKVTLSPEAASEQAKALEGLDDTSLIKDFPRMKWSTPEQDAEWEANKDLVARAKQLI